MQASLKKVILATLVIMILALSLKLTASRSSWGPLKVADKAITTIYSYAARAIIYPVDAIRGFFSRVGEMWRVSKRTQRLKEREAEIERLKIEIEQLRRENERLAELLSLAQKPEQKAVAARVIDRITNPRKIIVVDNGKKSGIREGQAAISANGLVGYVSETGQVWSKITLVTDPLCAVDAFVERSLEHGIVRGYKDGLLMMNYLPETADIKEGDLILTSGKGVIFPRGIPIGQVVSLEFDPRTPEIKAVIRPSTPINKLTEILIISQEEAQ